MDLIYFLNVILMKKSKGTCFKDNLFLMDILLAWRTFNKKKDLTLCYEGQSKITEPYLITF